MLKEEDSKFCFGHIFEMTAINPDRNMQSAVKKVHLETRSDVGAKNVEMGVIRFWQG